jgi:adenosylcobyric acid synthase
MIQGVCSSAGKSFITAGLCRIFKQDGFKTAPFKSQNMALNSYVGLDGCELGRAQAMQAECAGIIPDARMNPILLKPTSDQGSQVIINGASIGNMSAGEYFARKKEFSRKVLEAYHSLAAEYDLIVIEGAGSPAEINLRENDIVNMGLAEMVDAPVLLAGDIDRGGVFASLYGTAALLAANERARIKGVLINKFRGNAELLAPGLKMFEDLAHIPVVGVIPFIDITLDDEDSLAERLTPTHTAKTIDIAVIRLPKISNFTDFNALENIPDVSLRYVAAVNDFKEPDLVIIPGSKSVMADLAWLRQNGLAAKIEEYARTQKPIIGICGGYQILGQSVKDPLGVEALGEVRGLGLLGHETIFESAKVLTQVTGHFGEVGGVLSALSRQPFSGYEIHMGRSVFAAEEDAPLISCRSEEGIHLSGSQNGSIYGCYAHGLFDSGSVREGLLRSLCQMKGLPYNYPAFIDTNIQKELEYDKLADHLRKSLDMKAVYEICGVKK